VQAGRIPDDDVDRRPSASRRQEPLADKAGHSGQKIGRRSRRESLAGPKSCRIGVRTEPPERTTSGFDATFQHGDQGLSFSGTPGAWAGTAMSTRCFPGGPSYPSASTSP
jgi:hypothetical protein